MPKPKLLIFASGKKDGGGSGFAKLAEASQNGTLNAEIVGVVSNHENGGVKEKAYKFNIPFIHFQSTSEYQKIVEEAKADFVALSGWLKLASGLDPKKTFNIHPGPLPQFGGKGWHGHYVHEEIIKAYKKGEITHSAVSMHFATPVYDKGPLFFKYPVEILDNDTAESLGKKVNEVEHKWQPIITNLVVNGDISWDGKDPKSLKTPSDYKYI